MIDLLEDVILAGLVPNDPTDPIANEMALDNLRYLTEQTKITILPDQHRNVVECCSLYAVDTDWIGALTQEALLAFLQDDQAEPAVVAQYSDLYCRAALRNVTQAAFRFAVKQSIRRFRSDAYADVLSTASTIRTVGAKVGKQELKGYADSVSYLRTRLGDLDEDHESSEAGGDFMEEAPDILQDYLTVKANPQQFVGWKCGIDLYDDITNGAQDGELHFINGYTRSGKSHFVGQMGLHGAVEQKRNTAIFLTEMPKKQYRRRLALRHLRNPKFGSPSGIDADRFRRGKLTDAEEAALKAGIDDLFTNRQYGRLYIFKVPPGKGLDWIESKLIWLNTMWQRIGGVRGAIIDSLNQIGTGVAIEQARLGFSSLIRATKQLALGFDRDRGIPIVVTWHAGRKANEEAVEKGFYSLRSWTETGEVEMSADSVSWLLRIPNQADRHEVLFGNDKYRDARDEVRGTLFEDFGSGYLGMVETRYVPAELATKTGAYGLF